MKPFVFVNLAMSADGKLSTTERRQVKISGKSDFLRVDEIKAGSDAIMVGIGTVIADDPSLTVKSAELKKERIGRGCEENPVRIVIDSEGRTPENAEILHKGPGRRIIAVSEKASDKNLERLSPYADIIVAGKERVDLGGVMEALSDIDVKRVMVEGGGSLIWSLFEEDLVDEFYTCVGNIIIGGQNSPTPADGTGFIMEDDFTRLELIDMEKADEGVLLRWRVKR